MEHTTNLCLRCLCFCCCVQVVVRSLAELNKTALLGANLTNVTAAPIEVQSEASGQQYNATGAGGKLMGERACC